MGLKYKNNGAFKNAGGSEPTPWYSELPTEKSADSATITYSGTPHTKSGWTEVIASTSGDAGFVWVQVGLFRGSAENTAALLDIGIGAAGSETVVIPNISVGGSSGLNHLIPLKVAAGSRISARAQCVTNKNIPVTITTFTSPTFLLTPTSLDAIGVDTATSGGTAAGSSDTWVELTASSASDYTAFVICAAVNGNNVSSVDLTVTVGHGSAGSETELGSTVFNFNSTEAVSNKTFPFTLVGGNVPAGSRIVVKQTGLGPGGSNYGLSLIAIPAV